MHVSPDLITTRSSAIHVLTLILCGIVRKINPFALIVVHPMQWVYIPLNYYLNWLRRQRSPAIHLCQGLLALPSSIHAPYTPIHPACMHMHALTQLLTLISWQSPTTLIFQHTYKQANKKEVVWYIKYSVMEDNIKEESIMHTW